ncbi:MAG: hypothetical protein AB7N80_14600 [Bdellovibrionales bacterium]
MRCLLLILLALFETAQASQLELLRCVQELGAIRSDKNATLEFQVGLAVGSGQAPTRLGPVPVLYLANERGIYTFRLRAGQFNRLQVEIPHADPRRPPRRLFLTYLQSQIYGSRLQTIDWDAPPLGTSLSQFTLTTAFSTTTTEVQNQLVRLIQNELLNFSLLYRQGQLARADLLAGNLSFCRRLETGDQQLAQSLRQQVQELEMVSTAYRSTRQPASSP